MTYSADLTLSTVLSHHKNQKQAKSENKNSQKILGLARKNEPPTEEADVTPSASHTDWGGGEMGPRKKHELKKGRTFIFSSETKEMQLSGWGKNHSDFFF